MPRLLYRSYRVETADGYILNVQRIPNPGANKTIFLQHGLLASSSRYMAGPPDKVPLT
jgi:hypothetical protein